MKVYIQTFRTQILLLVSTSVLVGFFVLTPGNDISAASCSNRVITLGGQPYMMSCSGVGNASADMRRAVSQGVGIVFFDGCKLVGYSPRAICGIPQWGGQIVECQRPPYVPAGPSGGPGGPGGGGPGGPGGGGFVPAPVRPPEDLCLNIEGLQETMPVGFRDVGGKICQLDSSFNVFCSVSDNPVQPQQTVSFSVSPFNHAAGEITYVWRNAATGQVLGTRTARGGSAFSTSFETTGVYQVTVQARDSSGKVAQRSCGVTVSTTLTALPAGSGGTSLRPEVSLTGGGLTNNTCPIQWAAKDVIECYLAHQHNGTNVPITAEGEREGELSVQPGVYRVRCISAEQVPRLVESEHITCHQNPDIREF